MEQQDGKNIKTREKYFETIIDGIMMELWPVFCEI